MPPPSSGFRNDIYIPPISTSFLVSDTLCCAMKSGDSENGFHVELVQVFDHFPEYHMKTPLRDFNTKLRSEDILQPPIQNESK
jgi:hypothetical protein